MYEANIFPSYWSFKIRLLRFIQNMSFFLSFFLLQAHSFSFVSECSSNVQHSFCWGVFTVLLLDLDSCVLTCFVNLLPYIYFSSPCRFLCLSIFIQSTTLENSVLRKVLGRTIKLFSLPFQTCILSYSSVLLSC